MRTHGYLVWTVWAICLATIFFLSACAGPKRPPSPQALPAENLPQIGTSQAAVLRDSPRSKILVNLIKKAEQQMGSGEPDAAFATLERGVGIEGQDPFLWHLMARVQLIRGNFDQAEQLAKRSTLLAHNFPSLKQKNRDIIARSIKLREAE